MSAQVTGSRWAIAAGHRLACEAAAEILEGGGNAVDAGVCAGLTLGVVHPDMVSFLGVAPILVHLPSGETWQVAGVGPYPRTATREWFVERHGGKIPLGLPRTVVPAAPDAWCTALARWGTLSFVDVAACAIDYAARGFPLSRFSAYQMAAHAPRYRRWPTSAGLYLKNDAPYAEGDVLVQSELADTLRRMVTAEARAGGRREDGIAAARDEIYLGETARRIDAAHRSEGGPLTAADLAEFRVEVAPALKRAVRGYELASCGFWCQGPVLLQMLNMLGSDELSRLGHGTPEYLHLLVETMRLSLEDRDAFYGDPKFVDVPEERLLSIEHARMRRSLVGEQRTSAAQDARSGPRKSLDTSYVAVVDAKGNGFSATPSDPNIDAPVIPGVGCVVSPRGSQGWLDPAHPSVVAPGKRPRLTPAPAMLLAGGKVAMPFGSPGGDVQAQAMLQFLLNTTVFGMTPQEAVEAPRIASRDGPDSFWPHAREPGAVCVEARVPADVQGALARRGHEIVEWDAWDWRAGGVCAVRVDADGALSAAADPRRGAHAIAR